jgi:uncharacterized membrane protein YfcA
VSDLLLAVLLAIVALLYSAVGQAGGTGYIAAMGLVGLAPEIIKPTALALNILVAAIACLHFWRRGASAARDLPAGRRWDAPDRGLSNDTRHSRYL